ncbi:MAG: hypothetical protein LW817_05195 [Candidatus Caenarcaniphilales bacterium]|nr:hypothetical protein [Candidatus Caenarcaniphilales bacterium]
MNNLSSLINKYIQESKLRLHTPAHAGKLNPRDLSEVGELDDLQNPEGVLKDLQENIAQKFNAQKSFVLLNGATIGMQTAMLAIKMQYGDSKKILVSRNAHKSTLAGIILSGLDIDWLEPSWDEELNRYTCLNIPNDLENYSAVVITNPSYEGFCSEIPRLDIPLIVDEAHGAHYHFSKDLPKPALEYGADIVVQSWHKTLGSLTQTGVLHLGIKSQIKADKIQNALNILQTTSPSYLLLESLSQAAEKEYDYDWIVHELKSFDRYSNNDPTRLLIKGSQTLDDFLEKQGIYCEQNLGNYLQFNFSNFHNQDDIKLLRDSLLKFNESQETKLKFPQLEFGKQVMNCQKAFYSKSLKVNKVNAIGKISQELFAPCPPGIALLVPGQIITASTLARIDKEEISIIA